MELAFLTPLLKDGANRISGGVTINDEGILEMRLTKDQVSWNTHFYLFLPIFCILHNQVTIPSLHVMARKYSHVMVCHMSDCVVLVDQACDESRG